MRAKRQAMYRLTSIEGVRPPSSQRPSAEDLEEVKQKMNAERQAVSADEYTPTTARGGFEQQLYERFREQGYDETFANDLARE